MAAEPHIISVHIFTQTGQLFAQYPDNNLANHFLPQESELIDQMVKPGATQTGHQFHSGYLDLWERIVLDGEDIGTIFIRNDLEEFKSSLFRYAVMGMIVLLASILVAYVLSSKFQRVISSPILSLAQTAKRVSKGKNYSIRAEKKSRDELGTLIDGFNEMLEQIQMRDEALQRYRQKLEEKVAARTAELSDANQGLEQALREQRKAKESAESANRAKSDFLANMSHELRTPLNHIIGFTELVIDKYFGDLNAVQEEYLNDVLNSSNHLLSLINDILDLSKVEAGKLELDPVDVDLKDLLAKSLLMVKEKAMKHSLQIKCQIGDLPGTIRADERKLKQIIYNLLSNSVKFTPDGGTICLSADLVSESEHQTSLSGKNPTGHPENSNGNCIEISVMDTGIGLKQENLSRIFSPFEQVEISTSRRFQGTGLGLSLTKKLVELHNGRIWAESEGEGKAGN